MLVGMAPEPATRAETPEQPVVTGLTSEEAALRLRARGSLEHAASSRSYASIVRANVLTVFNLILAVVGALTLAFGDWQDALFLGILVANAAIGIAQEVRAKRALDRLSRARRADARRSCATASARRLRRRGASSSGDLVRARAGDQVVADGTRRGGRVAAPRRVDPHRRVASASRARPATSCAPGSFAVEGAGAYTVTAVGEDSYAARVTGEARAFRHPRSPLERALNRLLFVSSRVMVPLGVAARLRAVAPPRAASTTRCRRRSPRSSRSSPRG